MLISRYLIGCEDEEVVIGGKFKVSRWTRLEYPLYILYSDIVGSIYLFCIYLWNTGHRKVNKKTRYLIDLTSHEEKNQNIYTNKELIFCCNFIIDPKEVFIIQYKCVIIDRYTLFFVHFTPNDEAKDWKYIVYIILSESEVSAHFLT